MDTYDPQRRHKINRARDRQSARQRKRGAMATPREPLREREASTQTGHVAVVEPAYQRYLRSAKLWVRDALWYARHNALTWKLGIGAVIAAVLVFILWHVIGGKIYPNVWAIGINLGGLTTEEAAAVLRTAWADEYRISLTVDGQPYNEIAPGEIGLRIDALATAEAAKAAGMTGIPFGTRVEPLVSFDYLPAEQFMLSRAEEINTDPYNAGFDLVNGQVVGVPGRDGRALNITTTLERIQLSVQQIVTLKRFDLATTPIPPQYVDPEPFIEDVRAITREQFQFTSYDPFSDASTTWATAPANVVKWLQAGSNRLMIRESEFKAFIGALNETIASQGDTIRYIDHEEATQLVGDAIARGQNASVLRYRYRPEVYTVTRGDNAYRISRKTGIPFYKMVEVNPGRDLGVLYVGDQINLPPRDVTLPNPPVPHKRIVVDLDTQQLYAFEHGQIKFQWRISSGMSSAPTAPGIYQVLNHDELAFGSSFTLCSADTCGQWKMHWFMGIYEVAPGLVNGFHGAVELPNGAYLGGGNVSSPSTFGCIMSLDELAKELYDWADVGTMVEIISGEFEPRSELARAVRTNQFNVTAMFSAVPEHARL